MWFLIVVIYHVLKPSFPEPSWSRLKISRLPSLRSLRNEGMINMPHFIDSLWCGAIENVSLLNILQNIPIQVVLVSFIPDRADDTF